MDLHPELGVHNIFKSVFFFWGGVSGLLDPPPPIQDFRKILDPNTSKVFWGEFLTLVHPNTYPYPELYYKAAGSLLQMSQWKYTQESGKEKQHSSRESYDK